MKKIIDFKDNRGVMSLIVILGIGFFILAIGLTLTGQIVVEIMRNRNTIAGDQSFFTAEAAAREGVYQYRSNASYLGGTPQLINNTVSGEIIVTDIGWPYIEAGGKASNITNRNVIITLNLFPEGEAFDHAIYSQHNLWLSGNTAINGSIFANNSIDINNAAVDVNGNAFSPNEFDDNFGVIDGDIVIGVDPIPQPEIDLTDYINEANANGTYFMDKNDAQNYLNGQSQTAVVFIEDLGETHIQGGGGTTLNGSLVTKGNLRLSGGTYNATGDLAAIIVEGNLRIGGGTTINGIVIVKGNATLVGGGGPNTINITGALIVLGETNLTSLNGNININYDLALASSWQNLTGLILTSSVPSKIKSWREE